ncbi:DUF488 domain-containing protein [Corynebacterium sp. H130]|uniref:DUF488 domain-containing protein n=1 Tax=Corynebacterium sp. H130 TaxID=3133444 RepID=UPI0030AE8933
MRVEKIHDILPLGEGTFVLVDRLWPRGIAKQDFAPALWAKGAAPSSSLRQWVHAGGDWDEFARRYRDELDASLDDADVQALIELARSKELTLVYASKDRQRNHAHVLAKWLADRVK